MYLTRFKVVGAGVIILPQPTLSLGWFQTTNGYAKKEFPLLNVCSSNTHAYVFP